MKPWQVKQRRYSVFAADKSDRDRFWYKYLSFLLRLDTGHDAARRDGGLVREWIELSTSERFANDGKKNLHVVASKTNEESYHRDLPFLLDTSVNTESYELALDLVTELISHPIHNNDTAVVSALTDHLRSVGKAALRGLRKNNNESLLEGVMDCYRSVSRARSEVVRRFVRVPDELRTLASCLDDDDDRNDFRTFLTEHGDPKDVLTTLANDDDEMVPTSGDATEILRRLLSRAARESFDGRRSGDSALLRLKRERQQRRTTTTTTERNARPPPKVRLWDKLLNGDCYVDK